jgi:threonine synthase
VPTTMLDETLGLVHASNGPTGAFKDVAMQLLGQILPYALAHRHTTAHVVGATSGDTGGAAIEALRGKPGVHITMLYPRGRVSRVQRAQMDSVDDANVQTILVDGTFDDCQALVKQLFADEAFALQHKLATVNSINWVRIMAQVVYYVYAWLSVTVHNDEEVIIVVPSANFGNVFAGMVARFMGLPITIVVATNENDVLHHFFQTGTYRPRGSVELVTTSSPSMDILTASNFERAVFEWLGRDRVAMQREWTDSLAKYGRVQFRDMSEIRSYMLSHCTNKKQVLETIRGVHARYGRYIDPHTAVAMRAALELRQQTQTKTKILVLETALPFKFQDTMEEALGHEFPLPQHALDLLAKKQRVTEMSNDIDQLKQLILRYM